MDSQKVVGSNSVKTNRDIEQALAQRVRAIESAIMDKKRDIKQLNLQLRQMKKAQAALRNSVLPLNPEPNSQSPQEP